MPTDNPLGRPWLATELTRVDELVALPENWDSYHADPVAEVAADHVRSLLHMLSAWHTVNPDLRPQLCPTVDGGIQIEWQEHGYNLEITVEPDGKIAVWLERIADDASMEWPPEVP